jgi:hypothetical protein
MPDPVNGEFVFVETLIALDQFDSEVGDLPGIIPLLSNAIFHTS